MPGVERIGKHWIAWCLWFLHRFWIRRHTEDGNIPVDQKPPAAGPRWILESVTQTPSTPPKGWSCSSGSASLQVYNGDKFSFSWTPPPQQIDANGFSTSISVQATAAGPNNRISRLIKCVRHRTHVGCPFW
ncbi:hypothetical protein L0222_21090 [bacterium]|nr:hypothetical protein [bacterium]MCI0606968.1 hypothetical protein [bacterium]